MSIHSIDHPLYESIRPRTEQHGARKAEEGDFARQLQQAQEGAGPPADAFATAELLRLEMMQSAISLCRDEQDAPPAPLSGTRSMQNLLQLFRSNQGTEPAVPPATEGDVSTPAANGSPGPASATGAAPAGIDAIVQKAAARYGVDERLIKAVIKAESNFNPNAVSHAGAQGLMQLMPATARGIGVTNPFDPEQNVMGGTKFLKAMLDRYGGDVNAALAAYNWGPGNVDRNPASLPRETRTYLAKVTAYYAQFTG